MKKQKLNINKPLKFWKDFQQIKKKNKNNATDNKIKLLKVQKINRLKFTKTFPVIMLEF